MWLFIRLMLALAGFAIRTLARGDKRPDTGEYEGTPYRSSIRTRKGSTTGFEISMQRATPTWIRLHAESAADRAFKAMGIANEIQTGDEEFDKKVYVTCDHPHVATVLTESKELRDTIRAMLEAGYSKVFFDGTRLRADRQADYVPTTRDLQMLHAVWTASWKLSDAPPSRFGDRFLWKALLVEGVIWSVAGYAIGATVELFWAKEDYHLDRAAVWKLGLITSGVAFAILLLVIALWMRGSSRGHRIIVESAIVLLLALPISSIQVVSDTNRSFDGSAPVIIDTTYSECEIREHRGRRGRRSYSYHLYLNGPATLPSKIETTRELCDAAIYSMNRNRNVQIAIGKGRWGLTWYRWIKVDETTWKNPA
ncbi:MAG: hypothetical protein ACKV2T_43905 [Kofleriaceae bacterium]